MLCFHSEFLFCLIHEPDHPPLKKGTTSKRTSLFQSLLWQRHIYIDKKREQDRERLKWRSSVLTGEAGACFLELLGLFGLLGLP